MLSMSFDFSETNTSRPGSLNGGGRSSTALTTLIIAVFAPIPSASVSTATAVKPGFFSSWWKAKQRSFINQNPKSEGRNPKEARNPNIELSAGRVPRFSEFGIRFSFISQRLHGIDTRRVARGQVTREQSDKDQQ